MTQPTKSSGVDPACRSAWEPPVVTEVPIRSETQFVAESGRIAALERFSSDQSTVAHPEPPGPPATKLGFWFEMAFPLSARTEK